MQKMSTVTERPFAKAWGISSTLIFPRLSMWKNVKNQNTEMCQVRRLKYVTFLRKSNIRSNNKF